MSSKSGHSNRNVHTRSHSNNVDLTNPANTDPNRRDSAVAEFDKTAAELLAKYPDIRREPYTTNNPSASSSHTNPNVPQSHNSPPNPNAPQSNTSPPIPPTHHDTFNNRFLMLQLVDTIKNTLTNYQEINMTMSSTRDSIDQIWNRMASNPLPTNVTNSEQISHEITHQQDNRKQAHIVVDVILKIWDLIKKDNFKTQPAERTTWLEIENRVKVAIALRVDVQLQAQVTLELYANLYKCFDNNAKTQLLKEWSRINIADPTIEAWPSTYDQWKTLLEIVYPTSRIIIQHKIIDIKLNNFRDLYNFLVNFNLYSKYLEHSDADKVVNLLSKLPLWVDEEIRHNGIKEANKTHYNLHLGDYPTYDDLCNYLSSIEEQLPFIRTNMAATSVKSFRDNPSDIISICIKNGQCTARGINGNQVCP